MCHGTRHGILIEENGSASHRRCEYCSWCWSHPQGLCVLYAADYILHMRSSSQISFVALASALMRRFRLTNLGCSHIMDWHTPIFTVSTRGQKVLVPVCVVGFNKMIKTLKDIKVRRARELCYYIDCPELTGISQQIYNSLFTLLKASFDLWILSMSQVKSTSMPIFCNNNEP